MTECAMDTEVDSNEEHYRLALESILRWTERGDLSAITRVARVALSRRRVE